MSNKAEAGLDKPGQADSLEQMDDSVLKLLRHKLQMMNAPLPGSIKQLFTQDRLLQQLEAKPTALNLRALDQTQSLQQNVDALAFSEQALIDSVDARRHRPLIIGGPGATAKSPYSAAEQQLLVRTDKQAEFEHTTTGRHSGVGLQPPAPGEKHFPDSCVDASLTPEFMQQWVDEILTAGITSATAPAKKNQIETQGRKAHSETHRNTGNVPMQPARLNAQQGQEDAAISFGSRPLKISYLHNEQPGTASAVPEARPQPGHVDATIQDRPGAQHHLPSGFAGNDSPVFTNTPHNGIALLQQLTQLDTVTTSGQLPQTKSNVSATPNMAAVNRDLLDNNFAWQRLEKTLSPAVGVNQGEDKGSNQPASIFAVTDATGIDLLDESERVAELVNEALVEQAMRNGVDLS